jgi:phosphatidylinositol kinase/protein kinase (PI-3  family)
MKSKSFKIAQDNFIRSVAGYSIICYLLQIKDRHNGNILLDHHGFCTHIDFGFMLGNSPGAVGFELAPFKFPQEYLEIMGGPKSIKFGQFKILLKEAFLALRKRADSILGLVEIMEKDSKLPCFTGITPKAQSPTNTPKSPQSNSPYPITAALRERFQLSLTETQVHDFIEKLVESSCNNVFTKLYDSFQVFPINAVLY